MAQALAGEDASALIASAYRDDSSTYNSSLLVCLPKKSTGQTAAGAPIFDPEATRPLMLVNTDNRIVAAGAKRRWERHFGLYVHEH